MTQKQLDFLIHWAKTCKEKFENTGHMLPSVKIFAENRGYTLTPNPTYTISENEKELWDNFIQNLINKGIIRITRIRSNQTTYEFTSIKHVEDILNS